MAEPARFYGKQQAAIVALRTIRNEAHKLAEFSVERIGDFAFVTRRFGPAVNPAVYQECFRVGPRGGVKRLSSTHAW
jgi:hypothetical protein